MVLQSKNHRYNLSRITNDLQNIKIDGHISKKTENLIWKIFIGMNGILLTLGVSTFCYVLVKILELDNGNEVVAMLIGFFGMVAWFVCTYLAVWAKVFAKLDRMVVE